MNKLLWLRLSSEKRGIQEGDDLPHAPFIFRMKKQIQTVGMILLHSLSLTPFRTMVPQSLSSNKDGISAVLSAMEAFPGNFQIQRHAFIVLRSICSILAWWDSRPMTRRSRFITTFCKQMSSSPLLFYSSNVIDWLFTWRIHQIAIDRS